MNSFLKTSVLKGIRFYQNAISPLFARHCRFTPTCSQYMYEAINVHGLLRGLMLGMKRLLKCHPFYPGGYDPVPEKNQNKK